jgi:hypothetical protein
VVLKKSQCVLYGRENLGKSKPNNSALQWIALINFMTVTGNPVTLDDEVATYHPMSFAFDGERVFPTW